MEEGRRTLNSAKRNRIYCEVVEILQEVPEIFCGFNPYIFAFSTKVREFVSNKDGRFFTEAAGFSDVVAARTCSLSPVKKAQMQGARRTAS